MPAGGPTPGVFFTRWITHFCAPAFLFLAGTSAFLYARKYDDVSRFLWTRGLWLVFLELTFLRVGWTFNFDFAGYEMAGVIWAIGWCMVLMAALVRLPVAWIGAIGVVIIAGHNMMDAHLGTLIPMLGSGPLSGLAKIFYMGFFGGPIRFGADGPSLIVLYSIVPWIGVMMAGYAFAGILRLEPARRDRLCYLIGFGALLLFLLLRGFNLYGDPRPWIGPGSEFGRASGMPAWLAFLDTSKYPASLLFLLMTLGPTIALIPVLEHARGLLAEWVTIFGRVPFFFYMLHIPLIHVLALVVSQLRLGAVSPWLFANHPMGSPPVPDGYAWSLPLLYGVWTLAIAILFIACRWFADLKSRRKDWWLSYL